MKINADGKLDSVGVLVRVGGVGGHRHCDVVVGVLLRVKVQEAGGERLARAVHSGHGMAGMMENLTRTNDFLYLYLFNPFLKGRDLEVSEMARGQLSDLRGRLGLLTATHNCLSRSGVRKLF